MGTGRKPRSGVGAGDGGWIPIEATAGKRPGGRGVLLRESGPRGHMRDL
jgi:hypothetical protein